MAIEIGRALSRHEGARGIRLGDGWRARRHVACTNAGCMSYRETNKPPGHTLHDLRRRVSWLRIRLDSELEPPPLHGCGEVLDVLVWGTLRRTREPIRAQVLDLAR